MTATRKYGLQPGQKILLWLGIGIAVFTGDIVFPELAEQFGATVFGGIMVVMGVALGFIAYEVLRRVKNTLSADKPPE